MVIAYAVHILIPRRIASFSVVKIVKLVDRLEYEKKYSELLEFSEPYLQLIGNAANRRLPLQRFHDKLEFLQGGMKAIIHGMWNNEEEVPKFQRSPFTSKIRRWTGKLAIVIPKNQKAKTAAEDITRVMFQSEPLRVYMAKNRPYFAIPLTKQRMFGSQQFFEAYMELLIADTGSVLYQELQNNQYRASIYSYEIPESNRLLHFLFYDAQIANDLEVWRPIGEHILKLLKRDKSPEFVAHINGRADYFEKECWDNSVYVGVLFFDLMVTAAAYQRVTWHMWLYYTAYAIDHLAEVYDTTDPLVDTSDEFPTITARLIYTILSLLCDWVYLVSDLPEDSPHRQSSILVDSLEGEWDSWHLDNNNIPMSAAMALGSSSASVFMSERIGNKFSGYMYEVILNAVKRLRRDGFEGQLRMFLIRSIIHGGNNSWRYANNHDYGRKLTTLLSQVDHILVHDVDDYVAELKKAYPDAHSDL